MFSGIFNMEHLIFYIGGVELLLLLLAQVRTNQLLKRTLKVRSQKKETIKQLKNEVKNGTSEIPVVKFEKTKAQKPKKEGYDVNEMAVLQEMMAEFFG